MVEILRQVLHKEVWYTQKNQGLIPIRYISWQPSPIYMINYVLGSQISNETNWLIRGDNIRFFFFNKVLKFGLITDLWIIDVLEIHITK
jgi:hypothetical protein